MEHLLLAQLQKEMANGHADQLPHILTLSVVRQGMMIPGNLCSKGKICDLVCNFSLHPVTVLDKTTSTIQVPIDEDVQPTVQAAEPKQ